MSAPPAASRDLELIRRELTLHQQWVWGKGGRRAELQFQDLSGLTLKGARLAEARLAGANLTNMHLEGVDLSRADLFGADLEGADLTGADLSGADLRGANLHRAILTDVVLRGADFRAGRLTAADGSTRRDGAAVLTEARLERALLCEAKLTGCDLSGADLMDADLSGADLSKCVLLGTDLSGANLTGVQLAGTVVDTATLVQGRNLAQGMLSQVVDPARRPIAAADFLAAVVAHEQWVDSGGAAGTRLDLDMVEVPAVDLAGRSLSGMRLRRSRVAPANWSETLLEMADFSYSDLSGLVLDGARLPGVTLRRAILTGARLAGAVLEPQPLAGGRTWPANLDGAILTEADLTNASLSGAILRRADLVGAIVSGLNMRGADLNGARRAPADGAPAPRQRRRLRRFTDPVLAVGSRRGTAVTRNWSFGGMALDSGNASYAEGEVLTFLVAAKGGGSPVPVQARVKAVNEALNTVSVSFDPLTPELKAYLNGIVPARYRLP